LGLRDTRGVRGGVKSVRTGPGWGTMLERLRDPNLLAASLGNLITSITFTGAVTNFFPVYVSQLGATLPAINTMFSGRAFTSTLARLPTGVLTNRVSSWLVIASALALAVGSVFMMSQTTSIPLLALLLVLEGVAFGAFLTAGHAFIAQHSTIMTRGTSIGVYATAGSMGSTFSPILLGIVADVFGVRAVFLVCGVLGAVALLGIVYLYTQRGTTLGPKVQSLPEKP
jgi:MFS family permease